MIQKRFVLVALVVTSVFLPFISHAQLSLPRSPSPFQLPIASGLRVSVSQGNNDTQHDHVGKAAWAFDFIVGQTNFVVTAAQGGTVIGASDSSAIQCDGLNHQAGKPKDVILPNCWTYANYVIIADDDGTTASLYMHLLPSSLKVSPNMHVNQGDPLGLAGTTGWSTGVHLHFQVENIPQQTQSAGWWWTQSKPVSFANPEVLAKDACLSIASNGIPQTGQCFVVSNSPQQTPVATTPVPTVNPVPQPTLTTDCGHLVTPWVALYQYPNFGGRELCFEGTGLINLADFGFDKQTQSINIAANGFFFDQPNGQGNQLGFYYGDEQADLGNWDNQISSFLVSS